MVTGLRELPQVPDTSQWASFVKNHDELTLDKLSDDEREEGFAALAPDPGMRTRKELPELGWGAWEVLDTDHPGELAHRCDWQGRGVLVLHNVHPDPAEVAVDLGDDVEPGRPMADLFADQRYDRAATGEPMALERFGYRWLRLPG